VAKSFFLQPRIEVRAADFAIANPVYCARTYYLKALQPLVRHAHPDTMEIFYVARGRQVFWNGGEYHPLTAGDVYVIRPGETHGSGERPQERNILYWYQVRLGRKAPPITGLSRERSRFLLEALGKIARRVFSGSDSLQRLFDEILMAPKGGVPSRGAILENRFAALILETLACERRGADRIQSPAISLACEYVSAHLGDALGVEQLAATVRLSPSRFKERFTHEVGMPPGEYILRRRIDGAADALSRGASIGEVADRFGFSSSQYFATAFKRHTGRTPRASRGARLSWPRDEVNVDSGKQRTVPNDSAELPVRLPLRPVHELPSIGRSIKKSGGKGGAILLGDRKRR
jgi:AraC-like DNA-binding protein